jgi:protein-S-isoprenylcysteine O-methyltransferase Ste14
MANALYVALLVAVIVAVDLLFFRDHPWPRLIVNVGLVLVFAAFYFRFLKRP